MESKGFSFKGDMSLFLLERGEKVIVSQQKFPVKLVLNDN